MMEGDKVMSIQQRSEAPDYRTKDSEPSVFLTVVGSILIGISIIIGFIGIVGVIDNGGLYRVDNTLNYITIGSGIGLLIIGLVLIGINKIIELLMDIRSINEIVFSEEIRSAVSARHKK